LPQAVIVSRVLVAALLMPLVYNAPAFALSLLAHTQRTAAQLRAKWACVPVAGMASI